MTHEFPAITLHQPWASLIFTGHKAHETRSFPLPERLIGQWVAIHAAKRPPALLPGLAPLCVRSLGPDWFRRVPRGRVLGLVRFGQARRTTSTSPKGYEDEISGDWSRGRWAWPVIERYQIFPAQLATGRQLWWRVTLEPPADLGEAIDPHPGDRQ